MSGFSNPIIGGGGGLVYPSIHSPDFKAGISGWNIARDGSAEFNDLSLRGTINGTSFIVNKDGIFFYSGPLDSPGISYNTGATAGSGVTQRTTQTITLPAGVASGDVMFLVAEAFTTSGASTLGISSAIGAWSQVGTTQSVTSGGVTSNVAVWMRVAGGLDPGAVVTLTSTGAAFWEAAVATYSGADTSAAVDVEGGAAASGVQMIACPAETTTQPGDWAVYLAGAGLPSTALTGPTAHQRQQAVSAANIGAAIYDSGGSVGGGGTGIGGGDFTAASTAAWWGAFTIGLAPAGAVTLIGSWAAQAGTDEFGFSYPAGLQVITSAGQGTNLNGDELIFLASQLVAGTGSDAFIFAPAAGNSSEQGTLFLASPTDSTYQAILRLLGESADGTQAPFAALFRFNQSTQTASGGVPLGLSDVPAAPSAPAGGLLVYSASGYLCVAGNGFLGPAAAVAPGTSDTAETWHNISLDAGWTAAGGTTGQTPQYRLLADGSVQLKGFLTRSAIGTGGVAVNSGTPLPSAYCPGAPVYTHAADLNRAGVLVKNTGVITAFGNTGGSTSVDLAGTYWPGS